MEGKCKILESIINDMKERAELEDKLAQALRALLMYANPYSYTAISLSTDPLCGQFADDFDNDTDEPERYYYGKLARKVLRDILKDDGLYRTHTLIIEEESK